jgi:RNA polymerase sigma-70 factor (sigma-E family)
MIDPKEDFDRFVHSTTAELLRTAYLITWDLGDAQDVVQETFLKVARRWPRVRRMRHPLAYARRVMVNAALDDSRRRARRNDELGRDQPTDWPDRANQLRSIELRHDLLGAVGALPPRQRAVLVLRYFGDLTEKEVALALGCSVGTVKSTASRGLERLQADLGSHRPSSPLPHRSSA